GVVSGSAAVFGDLPGDGASPKRRFLACGDDGTGGFPSSTIIHMRHTRVVSCLGKIDLQEVSDGTISRRRERTLRRENGRAQPLIGGSWPPEPNPRIRRCVRMARGKLGTGYPRLLGGGCSREGTQR